MREIEALFTIYKTAVFEKDLEAYTSIFDKNVRVFDMWGQWSYDGLDAWREMTKGWFTSLGSDRDVVSFDTIQIDVSADMAVASAFMRFTAVSDKGEELRFLENRLTWVARKYEDGWKIVHQHTSSPVGSDLKVVLNR